MNTFTVIDSPICLATTAAGKPCTYPAVRGSDPPLCELHGKSWLHTPVSEEEAAFYGRFLTSRENETTLAQMARPSRVRELVVTRALVAYLLDELQETQSISIRYKTLVPLILRAIKLASDLAKQLDVGDEDEDLDEVLDRLSDELDVTL